MGFTQVDCRNFIILWLFDHSFITSFYFALGITCPIFMVVLLGLLLKRCGQVDEGFVRPASGLVFNVGLPVILFLSIYRADLSSMDMLVPLLVAMPLTVLLFVLSWPLAAMVVDTVHDRGVFVQGAYRGNLAVIGLAFCSNAYGEQGLAVAAVAIALMTCLYNVLAVIALDAICPDSQQCNAWLSRWRRVWVNTVKNPLLIGIVSGFAFKMTGLHLPELLASTGNYMAQMTLPLALLCIGASMNLRALKHSGNSILWASLIKLVVVPAMIVGGAIFCGVRGMPLGILFFLVSSPTAVASFIQVKALKGNGELAANIVVLSTLLGIVTVTTGLLVLKSFALLN